MASLSTLGEVQDVICDCDAPCRGTPLLYPERDSDTATVVGSG